MAARIRTIKPEFYTHEKLFKLEQVTGLAQLRLAFSGLWTQSDREGRFKWRPVVLKLAILPYDQVDFAAILVALRDAGFLTQYRDAAGELYGWVPSWLKHQSINNRESESVLPPPADCTIIPAGPDPTEALILESGQGLILDASPTRAPRVEDASPTRLKGKGREGNRTEGKGKGRVTGRVEDATAAAELRLAALIPDPEPEPYNPELSFQAFYDAYPKKRKPRDAKKAWLSAVKRVTVEQKMTEAEAAAFLQQRAETYAGSPLIRSTLQTEPQFVPYPASWLNSSDYNADVNEWARERSAPAARPASSNGTPRHAAKLATFLIQPELP